MSPENMKSGPSSGETGVAATVRKDFPDTWIWKTAQTELVGGWMDDWFG